MPENSSLAELAHAAVRQILWLPWLWSQGEKRGGFLVLMSRGFYVYRRQLEMTGSFTPKQRHPLCACVHVPFEEIIVALAGGSMIRFCIDSSVNFQGAGLGSRHSVKVAVFFISMSLECVVCQQPQYCFC
jgi:hypothetical protein